MACKLSRNYLAEARDMEEGRAKWWIPKGLSFEQILKNSAVPPCSLNEFMDYLVHVEQNAQNLQFFLWFSDYIQRWAKICPQQRAMSKPWKHTIMASEAVAANTPVTKIKKNRPQQGHRRSSSQKLDAILEILEEQAEKEREREKQSMDTISEDPVLPFSSLRRNHPMGPSLASSSSTPKTPASQSMTKDCVYGNVATFTIQPFRDEISRIVRHYVGPLSTSTPRPLVLLTPEARTKVHRASQQTTHPSAILPALDVAEAVVRASHPKFIRWAIRNANTPRLYFCRLLGLTMVLLGVLAVELCSSLVEPKGAMEGDLWLWMVRAATASLLWWPGTWIAVSGLSGICVVRFLKRTRDVRPWELGDEPPPPHPHPRPPLPSSSACSFSLNFCKTHPDDDNASEMGGLEAPSASGQGCGKPGRKRGASSSSCSFSSSSSSSSSFPWLSGMNVHAQTGNVNFDPLWKGAMQPFGPANDHETGMGCWQGMSLWKQIFAPQVQVPREGCATTRRVQWRVVVTAGLWAVLVTAGLLAGTSFSPRPSSG